MLLITSRKHLENRNEVHDAISDALEKQGLSLKQVALESISEDEAYDRQEQNIAFFKSTLKKMRSADVIFFEASSNNTDLGYFLSRATSINKPVVVFHRGDMEPTVISVIEQSSDKMAVVRYRTVSELYKEVPRAVDFVNEAQDTRFNFFLSPSLSYYLDWVSQHRKMPRSVFLRNLIDDDMQRNESYQGRG